MTDFASIKATCRQVVHDHLAVAATYRDSTMAEAVGLTVRWHNKLARAGALEGGFDAEIIEGIDRLVFNAPEIARLQTELGIELRQGGRVVIPGYGATFSLEAEEPSDGPVNVYWTVVKVA